MCWAIGIFDIPTAQRVRDFEFAAVGETTVSESWWSHESEWHTASLARTSDSGLGLATIVPVIRRTCRGVPVQLFWGAPM